jgi:plasmid stabilization system protein ParE
VKLRFTRRVAQDLSDIAAYIRERDPHAALRVRAAILESLRNVAHFLRIGRRQAVEGVRKLVTRRYPYVVYYTVDESAEEVVIVAVLHAARGRENSDA